MECLNCQECFPPSQVHNFWYIQECCHLVCRKCIQSHIESMYGIESQVKCLVGGCECVLSV